MTRAKPSSSSRGGPARRNHRPRSDDRIQVRQQHAPPPPPQSAAPQESNPLAESIDASSMRFADLNMLAPILIQTITHDLGLERMTQIQEATVQDLLQNRRDVLAQAKTGTGKTIAFLLPAIQTMIKRHQSSGISLLVISPTRELAMQIAKEASLLLQRMPQYKVCFAIGGTNKDREEREILKKCDMLIATPGRLYDHLSNPQIVAAFSHLDTLVLDEADRLLDMGFMKDLKNIVECLPDKQSSKRHGMLFSATIAPHVEKFAHLVLAPDYKFITTIPASEVNTHERVAQLLITVPNFIDVLPATVAALRAEIAHSAGNDFKAIIFAPTAALADWYAHTLSDVKGLPPITTLHARVSQSKRTNVTNEFRTASAAILVATDVVARGMDFPNVSTVFQVGIPADRESYIHRLGRTARAGRDGRGIFIVAAAESFFPTYRLKDITFIHTDPAISDADRESVQAAAAKSGIQGKVYQTWLGYYKNHLKSLGWTPERLVAEGNQYAIHGLCAGGVPEIQKSTVGKMGLKGVKGLNIVANLGLTSRGGGEGRLNAGRGRGRGRGR